ncbi:hypothetical protein Y032_0028g1703 [Ancylostoma ceylanicum]|uniref:Uncharacterized protein n=1 Tax=Ancylostoma ceylanicum TaxID=53326 RepID=A0A016UT85_9BILA|nr:hypothetical protein Y032_0028g1703 [Ancylostoma ceylanicum]
MQERSYMRFRTSWRLRSLQKVVAARQSIHFLRRCLQHRVIPSFIRSRKLYRVCGLSKDGRKVLELELKILRMSIKNKKDQMFTQLKRCAANEHNCARYLETSL